MLDRKIEIDLAAAMVDAPGAVAVPMVDPLR